MELVCSKVKAKDPPPIHIFADAERILETLQGQAFARRCEGLIPRADEESLAARYLRSMRFSCGLRGNASGDDCLASTIQGNFIENAHSRVYRGRSLQVNNQLQNFVDIYKFHIHTHRRLSSNISQISFMNLSTLTLRYPPFFVSPILTTEENALFSRGFFTKGTSDFLNIKFEEDL